MISKKIGGKTYYYLATSARVGGRPRIVEQRYQGTAAEIERAVDGTTVMPSRTRHLGFGDLRGVVGDRPARGGRHRPADPPSEPYVPLVAAYGSSKPRGRAG